MTIHARSVMMMRVVMPMLVMVIMMVSVVLAPLGRHGELVVQEGSHERRNITVGSARSDDNPVMSEVG